MIRRGARIYAQQRYNQSEGIGSGDIIIIATIAPLLPFLTDYSPLIMNNSRLFTIFQLFFRELIIGSVMSILLAFLLNKKKAGQTVAFLP
ncbi:MAG: hypothetical protein H6766_05090 [Candidatus Peribacteria bacterium]|nr:MAG: hypothetical protein H6766_05090 [Candidatus Peribacteria bacterium]